MSNYAPCPKCSTASAEPVKFTWLGGVLGPKLLSHVKCCNCSSIYNGKTGKENTKGIVVYSLIVAILAFGLMFVLFAGLAIFATLK